MRTDNSSSSDDDNNHNNDYDDPSYDPEMSRWHRRWCDYRFAGRIQLLELWSCAGYCGGDSYAETYAEKIYCFENPHVNQVLSNLTDWEATGVAQLFFIDEDITFRAFCRSRHGSAPDHPKACFVCGCARGIGCFPPGVKITMTDGSLRNIEDVRAGDMVRNAKTGAPVKVGKWPAPHFLVQ